ncbi:MAG TPA: nitroreductase family protein [Spirochaetia bacterium]|nr:nitroreductase family protein [Spirochaetia bacterium]
MSDVEARVARLIRSRFSCRSYADASIDAERQGKLRSVMEEITAGPLGAPVRFTLLAPGTADRDALRGLGTYGFIRGSAGFVAGAAGAGPRDLEDYGYSLERIVLAATELELGTCWLGGTFARSSFSRRIALQRAEKMPAVAAVGIIADPRQARNTPLRRRIGSDNRLPWTQLFTEGGFTRPLTPDDAGPWAEPLEMVRLAPSASNRQPWRIVRDGAAWHFYLRRTRGYRRGIVGRLLGMNDIQRVDMGIAMCHFALTARETGLEGTWSVRDPGFAAPDQLTEYVASWIAEKARGRGLPARGAVLNSHEQQT